MRAQVLQEAEILEGSVEIRVYMLQVSSLHQKILPNLLPVCTAKDSDLWVTQIEGSVIEDAGVIKMDFLGSENADHHQDLHWN